MKINLIYFLYLPFILVFLSCKIDKKSKSGVNNQKEEKLIVETKTIKNQNLIKDCVDFFHNEKSKTYPITGAKIENDELPESLIEIAQSSDKMPEEIKKILFDGSILKLNCNTDGIIYYLIIAPDNGTIKIYLSTINESNVEITRLHGSYEHDFRSIKDYNFILDHDDLEVTKTNYTLDGSGKQKKVSKEVTKYKLTENGIVEM